MRPRHTVCLAALLGTLLPVGLPVGRAAYAADPAADDRPVVRHRCDLTPAGRRAPANSAEPGRQRLRFLAGGVADHSARRQRAAEPGAVAGARRGAGQFRADPPARRACQRAIPVERRGTAGGAVGVRPGDRGALRQQHVADHRRAAGAVWVPDRRRGRYPDQDRHHQSRPDAVGVWRTAGTGRSPASNMADSSGPVDWFITGDYLHDDRGIENPDLEVRRRSTTPPTSFMASPMSAASSIPTRGSA